MTSVGRKTPLVTLTFDLDNDIETFPSEGPNMSCLRIWRTSVQLFQRYLMHKQKNEKVTDSAKTLKTEPYLRAVPRAKMFYQTYTERKPPKSIIPGSDAMVLSAGA